MKQDLTRREFLGRAALAVLPLAWPQLSVARAATDARLVVVLLRGALDGMAAVAPYGDGRYARLRGPLALPSPGDEHGVLKLDGLFGLHPELGGLFDWYKRGHLAVVHAAASPYRRRSHFDGQNLLENGTTRPFGAPDGWLNRALAHMPHGSDSARERGLALGQTVPLILRGQSAAGSWAPPTLPGVSDETIGRIADLYAHDSFFSVRLAQALATDAMAPGSKSRGHTGARLFGELCRAAGSFLSEPDGPRIAVLESLGWDTHANQGGHSGQLALRLRALDRGLSGLQGKLGRTWEKTVLILVSEFGRTVAANGTRGTDHGTAGALFLAGGAVKGGRVLGEWPGLAPAELYEGRDLRPTTDVRAVFKSVLGAHMGISAVALEREVFPDSGKIPPLRDVVKPA